MEGQGMDFSMDYFAADPKDYYADPLSELAKTDVDDMFNNEPNFDCEDLLNAQNIGEIHTNSDLSSPFSSPHNGESFGLSTPEAMALEYKLSGPLVTDFNEGDFFVDLREEESNILPSNIKNASSNQTQKMTPVSNKPKIAGKKRGRPKKVPKEDESTDISAVTLTEDELLKLDSNGYEVQIAALKSERPLTFAEEECIKAQRRRIKNRESAHISRERKRQATDDLSSHITMLEEENKSLKSQLNAVCSENEALREQLQRYIKNPKQTGVTARRPTKRAASAATVLVVLFCFGLFFQQGRDEQPSFSPNYQTRGLSSLDEQLATNGLKRGWEEGNCSRSEAPPSPPVKYRRTESSEVTKWVDNTKPIVQAEVLKEAVMAYPLDVTRPSEIRLSGNGSEDLPAPSFDNIWESGLKRRPNTHYYTVQKLEQIFPPDLMENVNVSDEPYKMSFLIPSSSLPTRPTNTDGTSVVEILTQVIDISFLKPARAAAEEPAAVQVVI